MPKNNTTQHGISVRFEGKNVGLSLYPGQYYRDYEKGEEFQELICAAKAAVLEPIPEELENIGGELRQEAAAARLRTAVVNYESNKDWIKDLPHERVEDLALFAKWRFDENHAARVTDSLLSHLQLTKEEMLKAAKANTAREASLRSMGSVIREMAFEEQEEQDLPPELVQELQEQIEEDPLWVLTTKDRQDGAALMADSAVMKQAGEKFPEGFYALPSSVHEVLLLPKDKHVEMDTEELKHMVRTVNAQMLEPEERLSDNVYEYNGHGITLVGQSEGIDREAPGHGIRHRR